MRISEIVYNENNINLDDLLPINKVQTLEDAEFYKNKGYYIPITCNEFTDKHPGIVKNLDINKFYYMPNTGISPAVYYYDKEKFIFINFIYIKETGFFMPLDNPDEQVVDCVKFFENLYEKKDFSSLLLRPTSNVKMILLKGIIEKYNENFLYDLFFQWYKSTDYGFSTINPELIKKLVRLKSDEEVAVTNEKIKDFPDKLIVYRGEGVKSTPYYNAYSWTTDIDVARFFALRFNEGEPVKVYKAEINKKDIIEYFDDKESEVIVLPEHIKILERIDIY